MLASSRNLLPSLDRSGLFVASKSTGKVRTLSNRKNLSVRPPARGLFHYDLNTLEANERETTLVVPKDRRASKSSGEALKRPSLKEPFAGLQNALKDSPPIEERKLAETRFAKLPNGLVVASEETYSQMSSIGLYIKAGARFEKASEVGMAQVVERLMFRGTSNRTHAEVVGMLEDMGATATSSSYPDMIELRGEILRPYTDSFLSLVADSILSPVFTTEDVQDQVRLIMDENEAKKESAHTLITDALHRIAYKGCPLSQTSPSDDLHSITAETVYQYMRRNWTAPRFVLAGASVNHDELVSMASKYFHRLPHMPPDGSIPAVSPAGMPLVGSHRATYSGGMQKIPMEVDPEDPSPVATLAVAFRGSGIADSDVHMMFTLSSLMGGGDSFSSGGPGKGIHSRLYTNVLQTSYFVSHCSSFIHSYPDTALFGIIADCVPGSIASLLDIVCAELARMTTTLDEEGVQRAKNALKSQIFYNLESRSVITDDIARYTLAIGRRYSAAEICDRIDAITVQSLQDYARRLLSSSPVVVAVGPQQYLNKLPSYTAIERYFQRAVPTL